MRKELSSETSFGRLPADILVIMGTREGHRWPLGSGVVIGPGFAITSWHVIEEFYKTYHDGEVSFYDKRWFNGNPKIIHRPKFNIVAILPRDSESRSHDYKFMVEWFHVSEFSDLVLLCLRPDKAYPDYEFRWRTMQACPPNVGTFVDGLGYRCDDQGQGIKRFDVKSFGSRGQVTQVSYEGSTHNLHYSPGFYIKTPFVGGMSGGPIYTEDGRLCGLICADWDKSQGSVAYASAIYPLLASNVELDQGFGVRKYTVQDLCRTGLLRMRGHNRFQLWFDEDWNCKRILTPFFGGRRRVLESLGPLTSSPINAP